MAIRVLRILEYTYDNVERMTSDMSHWNMGANAVRMHGDMSVRSATMIPQSVHMFDDQGATCALAEVLESDLDFEAFKRDPDDVLAGTIIDGLKEKGFEIIPRIG